MEKWFHDLNFDTVNQKTSPYKEAAIGLPGFSVANSSWKTQGNSIPATQRDIMCYDTPLNLWVSDYNYLQWNCHINDPTTASQSFYKVTL